MIVKTIKTSDEIVKLLHNCYSNENMVKWSQFNKFLQTEDGCLISNYLSKCTVLLEGTRAEEVEKFPEKFKSEGDLLKYSFLVPEDRDEFVRLIELKNLLKIITKPTKNRLIRLSA